MKMKMVVSLALGAAVIVAACVSPIANPGLRRQQLMWSACEGKAPADARCATLDVPRDYAEPAGGRFTLAVAMLPALGQREGAIFMNPGGPGVSAVADLLGSGDAYNRLRAKYDIVTFDPRGVGASVPVLQCLDDDLIKAIRDQPAVPANVAERTTQLDLARAHATACADAMQADLAHFGTRDVARDIDLLRAALGDETLLYLGFSYGTYLGATFADMFPNRARRVVLDSAMNPANDYVTLRHDQAIALDAAIGRFTADCLARDDCPLSGSLDAALGQIRDVVGRLDRMPFTAPDGRVLSGLRMQNLIDSSMYTPEQGWSELRAALDEAMREDWRAVLERAYGPGQMVNPADSPYLAVMCHDLAPTIEPEAVDGLAAGWAGEAPMTGANRAWSVLPCVVWEVRAAAEPAVKRAEGAGDILVVGVTGDPATPMQWSRDLAIGLARARLLEWQGDGHIAYTRGGPCVDEAVERFLLDGVLPAEGTVCPP